MATGMAHRPARRWKFGRKLSHKMRSMHSTQISQFGRRERSGPTQKTCMTLKQSRGPPLIVSGVMRSPADGWRSSLRKCPKGRPLWT
eukprot:5522833-Prymnesium_polylepis.1